MRLWPADNVHVSVQDIPRTPSVASALLELAGSRWATQDIPELLGRRATLHTSVLVLALSVVAGGLVTNAGPAVATGSAAVAAANDSLAVAVQNSIIARAIPLTNQASDASYTVHAGDSLTAIAKRVGVSEEALLAYNSLTSSDALGTGMQLKIPDLSKVPPDQLLLRDTAPHDNTPLDPLPPQKPAPELTIHQVVRGESIGAIAQETGVTEATVMASNNLTPSSRLSIGETLVVPTLNGRLVATSGQGDSVATLAEKYSSSPPAILAANKLDPKTREVAPAQLVLIPSDAEAAVALRQAETGAGAGRPAEPSPANGPSQVVAAPAAQAQTAAPSKLAAPPPLPASAPGFTWPITGYISTYFSSWHNGIDIVNGMGTPVHAAQAGKVVFAGWDNSGYGYMVRIDHGNGLQTLYGHASKLIAKAGDYVNQGQIIMLVGSTGRSTGPHVHFSVFQGSGYNGLNPLKYLP